MRMRAGRCWTGGRFRSRLPSWCQWTGFLSGLCSLVALPILDAWGQAKKWSLSSLSLQKEHWSSVGLYPSRHCLEEGCIGIYIPRGCKSLSSLSLNTDTIPYYPIHPKGVYFGIICPRDSISWYTSQDTYQAHILVQISDTHPWYSKCIFYIKLCEGLCSIFTQGSVSGNTVPWAIFSNTLPRVSRKCIG